MSNGPIEIPEETLSPVLRIKCPGCGYESQQVRSNSYGRGSPESIDCLQCGARLHMVKILHIHIAVYGKDNRFNIDPDDIKSM